MTEADPSMELTKLLAEGKVLPEIKTNLMSREQLMLYEAFDFGAEMYHQKFLRLITLQDKLIMMSVKDHTRTDQAVEGLKALHLLSGLDVGLKTMDKGKH